MWMETGFEGANVYGHDAGGACSDGAKSRGENFENDFIVSNWGTSTAVGPLQVTYSSFSFQDRTALGGIRRKSAEVGCTILRDF